MFGRADRRAVPAPRRLCPWVRTPRPPRPRAPECATAAPAPPLSPDSWRRRHRSDSKRSTAPEGRPAHSACRPRSDTRRASCRRWFPTGHRSPRARADHCGATRASCREQRSPTRGSTHRHQSRGARRTAPCRSARRRKRQAARCRQRIDHGIDAAVPDSVDNALGVSMPLPPTTGRRARRDSRTRGTTIHIPATYVDRRRIGIGTLAKTETRMGVGARERNHPSHRGELVPVLEHGVWPIEQRRHQFGARSKYVSSARAIGRRGSSRHSLSPLSHSRPSIGASQSCQLSDGRGEPGCAAKPNPPRRCTSSITSQVCPQAGTAMPAARSRRSGRRSC